MIKVAFFLNLKPVHFCDQTAKYLTDRGQDFGVSCLIPQHLLFEQLL